MMNEEHPVCCKIDHLEILKLPFERNNWVLGFYDGLLGGFAMCKRCSQMFFYRCTEPDDFYLWNRRIYSFTKIDEAPDEITRCFGLCSSDYRQGTEALDEIIKRSESCSVSHICVADSYLQNGIWRGVSDDEKSVIDWRKHLKLDIDEEKEVFDEDDK